jgi:hypothetical protein
MATMPVRGAAEGTALVAATMAREEDKATVSQRIVKGDQAYETFLKRLSCAR